MINILQILPALGSGGIEKLILQWESQLKKNDMKFVFAVYRNGGSTYELLSDKGYKIYKINQVRNVGIRKYCEEVENLIKNENIKIVHINAGTLTWITLLAAKRAGVKIRILHAHTNKYNLPHNELVGKCLEVLVKRLNAKYSTIRLACSDNAGKYCFGTASYEFLKNGINLNEFKGCIKSSREIIRKKFSISKDMLVVGFVGRLEEQKNPIFALKVVNYLQKEKDVAMIIVGEGPLDEDMHKWCTDHSLKNVYFVGRQEKMSDWYSAMDIVLMPSLYEGLLIVAVEAQAMGIPSYISEFVPRDVILTDLVYQISLKKTEKEWAREILCTYPSACKISRVEELRKKGYDMDLTTQQLFSIYKREYYKEYK